MLWNANERLNTTTTRPVDNDLRYRDARDDLTQRRNARAPNGHHRHDRGGLLYFATRAEDEKLEELLQHPEVAVTMQGDNRFLSITGRGRIETDMQLARELWKPSMKLWFPEGASDPQLTLILVEPVIAEYWDRSGMRRLQFLWEAGKALVRGDLPDSPPEVHAKLQPD